MFNKSVIARLNYYFKTRYGMYDYNNGWLKGDCPFCGKENKFGVNVYRDQTNCFVCGGHGSLFYSIVELEDLRDLNEAKRFILNLDGKDIDEYIPKGYKEKEAKVKSIQESTLPEGFVLLKQGQTKTGKAIRKYIKGRGFNINKLSQKGWGYTEGNEEYHGYLIIPYYRDNKVIYFNARLVVGNGPRYKNPEKGENNIGKSMVWYNHDALYMYNTIYITEGAINAETIGPQAISSGGKHISLHQLNDVINSEVEKVIILLDPDALKQAVKLSLTLIESKKVKLVRLPSVQTDDGIKYLDCNDLGNKGTMRYVYSTNYMSYKDLVRIKNEIDESYKRPKFTY